MGGFAGAGTYEAGSGYNGRQSSGCASEHDGLGVGRGGFGVRVMVTVGRGVGCWLEVGLLDG